MAWPNHSHDLDLEIINGGYALQLAISDTIVTFPDETKQQELIILVRETALELVVRRDPTLGFVLKASGYNPEAYLRQAPQLFSDGLYCLEKVYTTSNGAPGEFLPDSSGYLIGPYRKRYGPSQTPRTYHLPPTSLNTYAELRNSGHSPQHDIRKFRKYFKGAETGVALSCEGLPLNNELNREVRHGSAERR